MKHVFSQSRLCPACWLPKRGVSGGAGKAKSQIKLYFSGRIQPLSQIGYLFEQQIIVFKQKRNPKQQIHGSDQKQKSKPKVGERQQNFQTNLSSNKKTGR